METTIFASSNTEFIPKDAWPPSTPDLNPLDFFIWSYMLAQL
jgi:hypothetical protein